MRIRTALRILVVLGVAGTMASAQEGTSVTQLVTIEVRPITQISVSGDPSPLVITDAIPGGDLTPVVDNHTTYSITTNLDNMKIVASIDEQMPAGTRLMVSLSSSKALSSGVVDLTDALSPVTVVSGLSRVTDKDQQISYVFAANADAPELESATRVVTLTVSN
ncbi:MAG: hypothetical protein WBD36_10645 [Bacteroidota bacterium]